MARVGSWKVARKAEEKLQIGDFLGLRPTWFGGDMGRYCLGACARGEVASLQPGKPKNSQVTLPGILKLCDKIVIHPGQWRGQRMQPRLRQN